jgi:putative FmdB family regulatory protein
MPTYEYRCKDCGEHLEVVQSFKDDPLKVCPTCQGDLRKVFSPIGISFKGSGFYKTDSRSKSSSSSGSSGDAKSDKSEKSEKSDTKTETKSDTKTETKSESKTDSSSGSSAAAAS